MGLMPAPSSTRVPNFRRPRPRPSWGVRLLDGWLMQHYALAVWLTTGVRRQRPPQPFAKLVPGIYTIITGQILSVFSSVFLFVFDGWSLPDSAIYIGTGLLVLWLVVFILPRLEKRALRQSIPARFRKLSEGQRRRRAWAGFLLFWAAFYSIFFVAASLN